MLKRCSRCKADKPVSEFYPKGGGMRAECKECTREARRDYYWQDVGLTRKIDRARYKEKRLQRNG